MKEVLEKIELAVRRTGGRMQSQKLQLMLEMLGDEICRIAMEESGGEQEEEFR